MKVGGVKVDINLRSSLLVKRLLNRDFFPKKISLSEENVITAIDVFHRLSTSEQRSAALTQL
jgi:hypothetical protein